MDTQARILAALERIRPALQMDGGDIRLLEWRPEERLVRVELDGACASGCDKLSLTMTMGVERVLKSLVPEIETVEAA